MNVKALKRRKSVSTIQLSYSVQFKDGLIDAKMTLREPPPKHHEISNLMQKLITDEKRLYADHY